MTMVMWEYFFQRQFLGDSVHIKLLFYQQRQSFCSDGLWSSLYSNNMEEIDNFLVLPSSSNKTQCTILLHLVFGIYSSGQDFIHGIDNNNNNNNNCLL